MIERISPSLFTFIQTSFDDDFGFMMQIISALCSFIGFKSFQYRMTRVYNFLTLQNNILEILYS